MREITESMVRELEGRARDLARDIADLAISFRYLTNQLETERTKADDYQTQNDKMQLRLDKAEEELHDLRASLRIAAPRENLTGAR